MATRELKEKIELANKVADTQSQGSYIAYLKHVVIDSRPTPARFGDIARDWQWKLVQQHAAAVETIAGLRDDYPGPWGSIHIMPRGHDKTGRTGRMLNWLLAYGKHYLHGVVGSGDAEQAGLLLASMKMEASLNPWLAKRLTFRKSEVEGDGGILKIMTSDAKTAFGETPDFIICDEWTHWRHENGEKFFGALFSARRKRPRCLFMVMANAGIKRSWQWELYQKAKENPEDWLIYDAQGQLPSWMDYAAIMRDFAMLPKAEAKRVYLNIWIDPAEECNYLTAVEVSLCERPSLRYQFRGDPMNEYFLVIDYGPKRDRTALAVMHQEPITGLIVVDRLDLLQGVQFGGEVPITQIRAWIEECRVAFAPNVRLVVDPYQLLEVIQHYERIIPVDRWEFRGGKSNYRMAEALRDAIVNQHLVWYPGIGSLLTEDGKVETLADELVSLVTKDMSYGYRFDHTAAMHDDRAAVLGMGVVSILNRPKATQFNMPRPVQQPQKEMPVFVGGRAERKMVVPDRRYGNLFGMG